MMDSNGDTLYMYEWYKGYREDIKRIVDKYQRENEKSTSLANEIIGVLKRLKNEISEMDDFSLYQYKKIDDYSLKQIRSNNVHLSIPSKFDDIFDSRNIVDTDGENEDRQIQTKLLACIINQNDSSDSANSDNGWNVLQDDFLDYVDKVIKISCFSGVHTNTPLWHFYADNYKGVCLEYNSKDICRALGENDFLVPVIYTKKYYEYNPFRFENEGENGMSNVLGTGIANSLVKYQEWGFEAEWRIIRIKEKSEFIEIPITSIILGPKISDQDKNKIRYVVNNNLNSHVKIQSLVQTISGLKLI